MKIIEYASRPRFTRRRIALLISVPTLVSAIILGYAHSRELTRWMKFWYVEYRCRHYQIASDSTPAPQPSYLAEYLALCDTGIPSDGDLYLMHDRTSKAGKQHLWVGIGDMTITRRSDKDRIWNQFNLLTYGFTIGRQGEADASCDVEIQLGYAQHAVVFGAKVDSADASHFEMIYEMDGVKGTIDYWVTEDPMHCVQFKVRNGPALQWQ